jgi:hypothetical protein
MNILQKIKAEQTTLKGIRKRENIKGVYAGLILGLLIGVTSTFDTIKFQELWRDYQTALDIMQEHEAWKASNIISGVVVTATAHASTDGENMSGGSEELQTPALAVKVIATTYNAEVGQTDADPFTMASGHRVYEGAVASNCLPFNTKIRINGETYTVEDRMNSRYTKDCGTENERLDIFKWERKDNFKKNLEYTKI